MGNFDQRLAHRIGRDLDETRQRIVQLLDQNDPTGNRYGTEKQRDDRRAICWREQSKTSENNGQPKVQQNQEWAGDAVPAVLLQRPSPVD